VSGDHKRLVQVVTNVLNNAIKFTPSGGRISVDIAVDDANVRIAVSDNGIGMPADLVRSAFDLFTQGERSPDRSQGGLGIGLALVKSIVELHGGQVAAESGGANQGSRFTISLPRSSGNAAREPEAGASALPNARMRVLIVDDNADAALSLAMLVTALGHVSTVALSSASALDLAASYAPDACLLDIGLPDIDGYELARRLRAHPATAGAKLIAVTGYGQEQDRLDATAAGFDAYFVKPADHERLAAALSAIR
jgi:CheY-like chemotaxis protein